MEYLVHFESCALLNGWDDRQRSLFLAVSLKGPAQQILANISSGGSTVSYRALKSALEQRFAPPNQVDLYRAQLKARPRKDGESLLELGQAIRRLLQLAYPDADSAMHGTLAKEQFLEALAGTDLRFLVWQRKPLSLEIEAFQSTEIHHSPKVRSTTKPDDSLDLNSMTESEIREMLQKTLEEMKQQKARGPPR